jgi:hypothetical protein
MQEVKRTTREQASLPIRSHKALLISPPCIEGWVWRCSILNAESAPKAREIHDAYVPRMMAYLLENNVEPAILFCLRENMVLAPIEQALPSPRFVFVSARSLSTHKFKQTERFLTQFKGNMRRQLDLRPSIEGAQPVGQCLEVDELLNSLCHYGTADIIMEFPVQG